MPQDGDLPHGARTKRDVGGARLRGIARDVEYRLDELLAIGDDLRQAGIVIAMNVDPELRAPQAPPALPGLVDAERLDARRAMRRQHAIQEPLQPVGLLDDHL